MKGTPLASCTVACDLTSCGTSGFAVILARNEVVSVAIRTERRVLAGRRMLKWWRRLGLRWW
jgi:hypothetical protein